MSRRPLKLRWITTTRPDPGRDAVSDLAHHFLAKMKIMVIKDVEREDIEYVCKSLNVRPAASLDHFTADTLASAELAEEIQAGSSKMVKVCDNIAVITGETCMIPCVLLERVGDSLYNNERNMLILLFNSVCDAASHIE